MHFIQKSVKGRNRMAVRMRRWLCMLIILVFLSSVLFLSHSMREQHEFFIRGGAFNRTRVRECMFVHMCIRMWRECTIKSLLWDAVDIHTLDIWANMRGSASESECVCVLPGNLSSGVEVQCSHWLQHLHAAHILQQRQRRQTFSHSTSCASPPTTIESTEYGCVAQFMELARQLSCMWLSAYVYVFYGNWCSNYEALIK